MAEGSEVSPRITTLWVRWDAAEGEGEGEEEGDREG